LVDISSLANLPEFVNPLKVKEVIDHRESGLRNAKKSFPKAKIQVELVGACATLIVEKYMEAKAKIGLKVGNVLYAAIYSNTLNLKSSNTTSRDLKAVEWLRKNCKILPNIEIKMFLYKKREALKYLNKVIREDFKDKYLLGRKRIGIGQLEIYGADELLELKREIIGILKHLKEERRLEYVMLNVPDIKKGKNFFIILDKELEDLLRKRLKMKRIGRFIYSGEMILRKQIEAILGVKILSN